MKQEVLKITIVLNIEQFRETTPYLLRKISFF